MDILYVRNAAQCAVIQTRHTANISTHMHMHGVGYLQSPRQLEGKTHGCVPHLLYQTQNNYRKQTP